jgi:hypothetical protein
MSSSRAAPYTNESNQNQLLTLRCNCQKNPTQSTYRCEGTLPTKAVTLDPDKNLKPRYVKFFSCPLVWSDGKNGKSLRIQRISRRLQIYVQLGGDTTREDAAIGIKNCQASELPTSKKQRLKSENTHSLGWNDSLLLITCSCVGSTHISVGIVPKEPTRARRSVDKPPRFPLRKKELSD